MNCYSALPIGSGYTRQHVLLFYKVIHIAQIQYILRYHVCLQRSVDVLDSGKQQQKQQLPSARSSTTPETTSIGSSGRRWVSSVEEPLIARQNSATTSTSSRLSPGTETGDGMASTARWVWCKYLQYCTWRAFSEIYWMWKCCVVMVMVMSFVITNTGVKQKYKNIFLICW